MLDRFVSRRDEAAFTLLVERYGPLVMSVCRRQLDEVHDAEDAFQATFLVLVRKAASIRKRTALGSWLHGVAARVASKARAQARLRATKERRAAEMPRDDGLDDVTWHELRSVLDEEIARLPERYRVPLILSYFQGKTHEQAARELGWPDSRPRLLLSHVLLQEHKDLSAAEQSLRDVLALDPNHLEAKRARAAASG